MDKVVLHAVGDIMLNREKPETAFDLAKPTLAKADLRFCQLEAIHIDEGQGAPNPTWRNATRGHRNPVRNGLAMKVAGFDVFSMAGNHVLDWGYDGMFKTMELVRQIGGTPIGAGKNLEEARQPAIFERKGLKIGFLAYNSILPMNYWATEDRPGCAPLRGLTVYDPYEYDQPGQPARVHTFVHKADLAGMQEDVRKLRPQVDILAVSMHYGLHFVPAKLADYQRQASYVAIDAGADVILGHHAHILKGIEVYKGKVIFYSLCNFAIDSGFRGWPNLSSSLLELVELYNWKIDPDWAKTYAFPPDSRKTILAKCVFSKKGVEKVSFLPVMINKQNQPEVLAASDKRATEVLDYMKWLCEDQKLGTEFSWDGDEVAVNT